VITIAKLFGGNPDTWNEIEEKAPRASDRIANPFLKKVMDFLQPSSMDMTGMIPVGAAYKSVKGAIPRFIDLFHGTTDDGAKAIADGGILNQLARAKKGFKEAYDNETLNHAYQKDAVYLASDPKKAEQYGSTLFKVRANPKKLRPDDDFLTDLSFSAKESGYMPPGYQSILNRLGKNIKTDNWVTLDNTIYDDFLKNPNHPDYKKLVPESLDYGQVAMEGSIPPYRIRSVKADHSYELFDQLMDLLDKSRPTLRR